MIRFVLIVVGISMASFMAPVLTGTSLYLEIHKADSLMFDAMNRQDLDGMMSYFDKNLELYHDEGGLDNYEQTKTKLASFFQNNRNTNFRGMLVSGSLPRSGLWGH